MLKLFSSDLWQAESTRRVQTTSHLSPLSPPEFPQITHTITHKQTCTATVCTQTAKLIKHPNMDSKLKLVDNILILHAYLLTRAKDVTLKRDLCWIYSSSCLLTNITADFSFILIKSVYPPLQIQRLEHITALDTGVMAFQIVVCLLDKQTTITW